MTPAEIEEQTISFVYGQLMDCAPGITREQVAEIVRGETARVNEMDGKR